MKKNNKNRQKRIEIKRMKRDKRRKNSCHAPRIEWQSDKKFTMHFDDRNINSLFSSVTVQEMEDEKGAYSVDMYF